MENVKLNLTEVPSVRTWKHDREPKTAVVFQERLSNLGNRVVGIIENKKNPAYSRYFTGTPKEVHQKVYEVKLEVGASEPNKYTQGLIPKKNTKKFIKNPRKKANNDYEVTFMPEYEQTYTLDLSDTFDTITLTGDYDGIDYKFNEADYIQELKDYIDSTYNGHYSKNKIQSTEVIIDRGHGTGFCMGNVDKYSNRYGKKGTHDDARKDLMKILHYALIQLYVHDNDL